MTSKLIFKFLFIILYIFYQTNITLQSSRRRNMNHVIQRMVQRLNSTAEYIDQINDQSTIFKNTEEFSKKYNLDHLQYFIKLYKNHIFTDSNIEIKNQAFGQNQLGCSACKNAIDKVRSFLTSNTSISFLSTVATDACRLFIQQDVCDGAIKEFARNLILSLVSGKVNSDFICGELNFCEKKFEKLKLEDFAKDVLQNKPQNITQPQPTMNSSYKVLHISDLHIDEQYQEGQNMNCIRPLCCRNISSPSSKESDKAGYWGSLSKCDIPIRTLEQAFIQLSTEIKPDMILWTGDNIQHDVWNQFQGNQTRPTLLITDLLKKYFPLTPIYPIFGNHECYAVDQFDFFGNSSQWLKDQTATIWKDLLDDQAYKSLLQNSYYAIYNKQFNVKTIVMNTQSCDPINFYALNDSTDLGGQLQWLRNELQLSEINNQQVFIIGHIPPGDSSCNYLWGARYQILAERYSHIIRGQFFGHTHNDQFERQRSYNGSDAVGTVFIAPSLTTYSYLNPSFRYFEVDKDTNILTNLYQYRLNLTHANLQDRSQGIKWDLVYDLKSYYGIPDLSPKTLDDLIESFENKEILKKYIFNFHSGTQDLQTLDKILENKKTYLTYQCMAKNQNYLEYIKCMGFYTIYDSNAFYILLTFLDGNWYKQLEAQKK